MKSIPRGDTPPTTRTIAQLAGVSSTAVSRALRNQPKVSAATRDRILAIAEELGYRPDPEVAKLMHHLQLRRKPRFQSTLVALAFSSEETDTDYMRTIFTSARQRAESLGYHMELMRVGAYPSSPLALTRMLRNRGIEGVLLLPLPSPRSLHELVDWELFFVVATTHGVLNPGCHRVVPDQFGNMLLLCGELARRGYRRIGLVIAAEHDLRVHHGFSAAVMWQNTWGGTESVRPLLYSGRSPKNLAAWFKSEKPDVIISSGESECLAIAQSLNLEIHGQIGLAAAHLDGASSVAGIDEQPGQIGAMATELLHSRIISRSRGIPNSPMTTLIPGRWLAGLSVTAKEAGPKPLSQKKGVSPQHAATPGARSARRRRQATIAS